MAAPDDRREEPAEDELEGAYYEANVNQGQHEPIPASPQDDKRQAAVRQNEAYAHGYAGRESREGQGEVPGDLTPGPEDPGSPPTHAAGGEQDDGRVGRIRRVARAARGRPDGEVDPHS